jgi:hypothetical protein
MNRKNFSTVIVYVFVMMFLTCSLAKAQNTDSFSNVGWNGKELTFTASKEVRVKNVSVFVADKELKATRISNSVGEMKFPNGATMRPGSSLMFGLGRIYIVLQGTIVNCEIEAAGASPSKARFYLDNGAQTDIIVDIDIK